MSQLPLSRSSGHRLHPNRLFRMDCIWLHFSPDPVLFGSVFYPKSNACRIRVCFSISHAMHKGKFRSSKIRGRWGLGLNFALSVSDFFLCSHFLTWADLTLVITGSSRGLCHRWTVNHDLIRSNLSFKIYHWIGPMGLGIEEKKNRVEQQMWVRSSKSNFWVNHI